VNAYQVNLNGKEFYIYEDNGILYTDAPVNDEIVSQLTYGVQVIKQDGMTYFIPTEHSGVRPEYRDYVGQILEGWGYPSEMAEHNQILPVVLLAVLGIGAAAAYYYREELGGLLWKVLIPLFVFGIAAWIGINLGKAAR